MKFLPNDVLHHCLCFLTLVDVYAFYCTSCYFRNCIASRLPKLDNINIREPSNAIAIVAMYERLTFMQLRDLFWSLNNCSYIFGASFTFRAWLTFSKKQHMYVDGLSSSLFENYLTALCARKQFVLRTDNVLHEMNVLKKKKSQKPLQIGDLCEAKDRLGTWYVARIVHMDSTHYFVVFIGWQLCASEWIRRDEDRLAILHTRRILKNRDTPYFQLGNKYGTKRHCLPKHSKRIANQKKRKTCVIPCSAN